MLKNVRSRRFRFGSLASSSDLGLFFYGGPRDPFRSVPFRSFPGLAAPFFFLLFSVCFLSFRCFCYFSFCGFFWLSSVAVGYLLVIPLFPMSPSPYAVAVLVLLVLLVLLLELLLLLLESLSPSEWVLTVGPLSLVFRFVCLGFFMPVSDRFFRGFDPATCKGPLRPPRVYNRGGGSRAKYSPSQAEPHPPRPPTPSCEIALYTKPGKCGRQI